MTEYMLTLQAHDLFTNISDDWGHTHTHTHTITHKHTHTCCSVSLCPGSLTWSCDLSSQTKEHHPIAQVVLCGSHDHQASTGHKVTAVCCSLESPALFLFSSFKFFHTSHLFILLLFRCLFTFILKINVVKKNDSRKFLFTLARILTSAHINVFSTLMAKLQKASGT